LQVTERQRLESVVPGAKRKNALIHLRQASAGQGIGGWKMANEERWAEMLDKWINGFVD
jgi:hypothetical protein